jgi:hypothetical protein
MQSSTASAKDILPAQVARSQETVITDLDEFSHASPLEQRLFNFSACGFTTAISHSSLDSPSQCDTAALLLLMNGKE